MIESYHRILADGHAENYRQEEVEALKRAIRARESRLVLGMPDVGTSNLLRFLVTTADWGEEIVTFAYVHCDTLEDSCDSELFCSEVARQFHDQLPRSRLREDLTGYERLKRLMQEIGGDPLDRLVAVADRANRMLEKADDAFYHRLAALTDLNRRICFIFAAGPQVDKAVDPQNELFAGHRLIVGPFNNRDLAGAILEEERRLGRKFSPAEHEQLVHLSGGHPGLLRAVASAILEEGLVLSRPGEVIVERLLARSDISARCRRIWQALDRTGQEVLQGTINGQLSSGASATLAWLQKFGLIEQQGREFRSFSPVFAAFVATQEIPPLPVRIVKAKTELIHGRKVVTAGEVMKGGDRVHVTPLELRLIACLDQEPRIFTKKEICEYVWAEDEPWKDSWLLEGKYWSKKVDDLVAQVRKRLGAQYIKTHWGKGYELLRE